MDSLFRTSMICFTVFVLGVLSPALYMLFTGDFPGRDTFYGIEEDHAIVDFILNIREFFV